MTAAASEFIDPILMEIDNLALRKAFLASFNRAYLKFYGHMLQLLRNREKCAAAGAGAGAERDATKLRMLAERAATATTTL